MDGERDHQPQYPRQEQEDDDGEEYLIIWDESTAPGDEKLTVLLDDGLYKRLEDDYGYALRIPAGKYAEVDSLWLAERAEI